MIWKFLSRFTQQPPAGAVRRTMAFSSRREGLPGASGQNVWRRRLTTATPTGPQILSLGSMRALLRQAISLRPAARQALNTPRRDFSFSARRYKVNDPSSFQARFKKLTREYGMAGIVVYLLIGLADFPICFLIVRAVGVHRIGELEEYVTAKVKDFIPDPIENAWRNFWNFFEKKKEGEDDDDDSAIQEVIEERGSRPASLGTQLALAYAIHKSVFLFIRLPLTIAITPKFVKILRGWGLDLTKKDPFGLNKPR